MMPGFVLSQYLTRLFFKWMAMIGGAVFTLIFLLDFSELVRKASTKTDISFTVLFQMVFLKMPHLLQQVLPFLILFTSILTLWILNRHHEMIVMKASGLSIWQILAPLMGVVWIIGAIDLFIFNPLSAHFMARYEHFNERYFQHSFESLAVSESGLWMREKKNNIHQIFHILYIDPRHKTAHKVSVYQFNAQNKFLKRIEAELGKFEEHHLLLTHVWEQTPQSVPTLVEQYRLPTSLSLSQIENTGLAPVSISFWKLRYVADLLEHSGLSGHKYIMYWHTLLAKGVWLGVMVILAAGCSLRPIRQQGTFALISVGLMSAFILYFLRDITYALGNSGALPVLLAAWTPIGMSVLLGISALIYFEER